MISRNDVILLLTDLEDAGIDIGNRVAKTIASPTIPIDVLKFINDIRPLELTQFYEKLRKSYNEKRSKLYINIVNEDLDAKEILTTLASYQLQALLYAKQLPNDQMFLEHSRVREVSLALLNYYNSYDLTTCTNLLKLIKADLMACENITGRRPY